MSNVIEQLEQERGVASKRARRLQEELQRVQEVPSIYLYIHIHIYTCTCTYTCTYYFTCNVSLLQERDTAVKKISDYKSKVTEVKQNSRKDITALQTKLAKVTDFIDLHWTFL